uniref:Ovule protein n=1 Tax=Ascaris lumbricoides TaxID=6252 RepID=A0A0M3I7E0_ASCLU
MNKFKSFGSAWSTFELHEKESTKDESNSSNCIISLLMKSRPQLWQFYKQFCGFLFLAFMSSFFSFVDGLKILRILKMFPTSHSAD